MPFSNIVCLDDLVRTDTWPQSELVFDLLRLPIFHASGLNIGHSPHRPVPAAGLPTEVLGRFRALCETEGQLPPWQALHHQVPQAAANYLMAQLPAHTLVLGHAMPPWLLAVLDQADQAWIDLRPSPLRFGSDLIMGLRTNRPALFQAALPLALSADMLTAQSSQLAARLRLQRRSEGRLRLPQNPCVFVGQTEDDPALVRSGGTLSRATDHAEILAQMARTGPMLYLAHPRAGDFARIEREAIARVTGQRLALCELPTYDLLACDDELMLLGLSAEALQEAAWFGRPAYALCPLPAQPVFDADGVADGYLQIASHVLLGERLWADLLEQPLRPGALNPAPQPNLLRELTNDWWGYAAVTQRGHGAMAEAFAQAGGQRQAEALRRCQNELNTTRAQLNSLGTELADLKALVMNTAPQQALDMGSGDPMAMPAPRARRTAAAGSTPKVRMG
jgi:hypothetical protein